MKINHFASNRRLWVWKLEIKNGYIWLISDNKERGTSYEVTKDVEWEDISQFIENLIDKLLDL